MRQAGRARRTSEGERGPEAPTGAARLSADQEVRRVAQRKLSTSANSSEENQTGEVRHLVRLLLLSGAAIAVTAIVLIVAGHFFPPSILLLLGSVFAILGVQAATGYLTYRLQTTELARLQEGYARARLLAQLNSSIIGSFAMAIDAKDQHTQGHTERVRDLAVMIGEEMQLEQAEIEALRMAAMLHDIGKLAVPDYILSKPASLTQEEMRKVQTHTLVGAALLESVKFPWPVVPVIRSHHEWWDGTGYPDGLAADKVPLGARILAVADVYDALLSHRPYRPAMGVEEATKFMRERSGTQFDPKVIEVCFAALAKQEQRRTGFLFDADSEEGAPAEQSSIFMNIRQAHQELLALYEIVQTMGQSLDVQETMDLVIGKTKRIIDFSTCVLFLVQPEEGHIVAAAASGPRAEEIRGRRMQLGAGVSGVVAQGGQPSGLGKTALEDLGPLLGGEARGFGLAHVLSAPLMSEETLLGALTLYRPGSRPFTEDDARLVVAVARQTAIAINNARQHEQTRQSAMTDQLTGLANARHFFMRLEQELSRARREHGPVSLVAVDLNGLKQINDGYGHQQGDRALRVIAEVFRRHVRDYDTVVRYAGDEFFIILPDTTNKAAVETTHRIKEAVRQTSLEVLPGRNINLSASFGVATFPGDAEHADALIAVADQAMYADKRLSHQAALLVAQESTKHGQEAEPGAKR
jgi:diguanylate cyclase (GGDEF)-like protein/putative nucleotidyltransferase with HDIG domain